MQDRICPQCGSNTRQVKAGLNNGRQQFQCAACKRRYVPGGSGRGYSSDVHKRIADLRAQGATTSQIAASLNITPRTVRKWSSPVTDASSGNDGSPSHHSLASQNDAGISATPPPLDPVGNRGSRRHVTIRDVAKSANVAPSTVSNYLNDKGGMNADTSRRIQDAIETLHFTPSALIRSIRNRRTRILGVVAFGLLTIDEAAAYSIVTPLLAGINEGAQSTGHDVLLYTSWEAMQPHGGLRFLDGHIDGLIVVGSTLPAPILARTAAAGLPITALLARHVPENVGYVNADNLGGMRAVVEHLVSLGRRKIGYFGPLHDSNHVDRYRGFSDAMTALGLTWDDRPMQFTLQPGEMWQPDKLDAGLTRFSAMASELDAMVIPNWMMAAAMVRTLRARSVRVPEDVAIVAFDDSPVQMPPEDGVTTIRQPLKQIGYTGVERLLALINGAPVSECRITLPVELIVRASTIGTK